MVVHTFEVNKGAKCGVRQDTHVLNIETPTDRHEKKNANRMKDTFNSQKMFWRRT